MDKKVEQKIVVLISFDEIDKVLILNGLKIASIFKKELCLVYNYAGREKNRYEELKQELQNYTEPIKKEAVGVPVSTLMISEKRTYLAEKLSDDLDAILILAPAVAFRQHSRSLAESPVPYLFIHSGADSNNSEFKKLIVPVDLRKESGEGALWASYFGRFNESAVAVVAAKDKYAEDKKKVTKNVLLFKKLFQKFNINHKIYKGTKTSWRIAFEALDLAHSSKSDLLIILGSSTITPLDKLIGLPERKLIEKAQKIPVLVVNPRKDNYILCD